MTERMLLKVGVVMMLLSLTLAVGVAVALGGLRPTAPETAAVSSVEPRAAETTEKKKEYNPGEQLKIDNGKANDGKADGKANEGKANDGEDPAPEKPAPESRAKSTPKPRAGSVPTSVPPDLPRPTNDEVAAADEPRYFDPDPGAEMTLTVEALGLYDVPVISSDDLSALDSSLMHLPETSFPWDSGAQRNVYIAGHYLGYPGAASRLVFYNLDKLKNGDEVVLKDGGDDAYRYRVSESFTAGPDESWVMGQELNRDMVTLQTCIPPTFETRLIVQADRV